MKAWAGDRLAPNRVGRTQLVNSAGSKSPGSVLPASKRRCFNTHSSMSKFETETRRLDVLQLGQLSGDGLDPLLPVPQSGCRERCYIYKTWEAPLKARPRPLWGLRYGCGDRFRL